MSQIWTRPGESDAYQLSYPQSHEGGSTRQKRGALIRRPPCQPESYQREVGRINVLLQRRIPALNAGLDAAKIPWTIGRPVELMK